jgi:hypothetical protein
MSIASSFLWRFLDDVWDLLPTEDRTLFEAYWSAQIQVVGNLHQKALEASLSNAVLDVPIFLTERWNRYAMDDTSCDLFTATETLTLTGTSPVSLARETAFYDTFVLSTASGKIFQSEAVQFFDGSMRPLRYGSILKGTVSVKIASLEYTENFDYAVNYVMGTIQGLPGGRLPTNQVATVAYTHADYKRGLDYEIDEAASTVARLVGSAIASGNSVVVGYTYNNTPTLLLEGANGAVLSDLTTFSDEGANLVSLLPARTLTILSGPNAGSYVVNAVLSPTTVQIAGVFLQAQAGGISYTINAFPHGQRVDRRAVSIPVLQERVDDATLVLTENADFRVKDGVLATRSAFPMQVLGPTQSRARVMWAEQTKLNAETPYRNFGVLIDFYRENSEAYKLALQGLWYAFWTGSTPGNLQRGLHILLGLPFAKKAGTVLAATAPTLSTTGTVIIQDARGQRLVYTIPQGLELADGLRAGTEVARFVALSTGVKIIDRNNEPGFVAARLGRAGIAQFLTSKATRGSGNTDETKALTLLEHHLFLPQILAEAVTSRLNVAEFVTFLDNMKPEWTTYVFSFDEDVGESLTFHETVDDSPTIDLTATVGSNEENVAWLHGTFAVSRTSGETIAGGTQIAGNFRDLLFDFAVPGIDTGDYVQIETGPYLGVYRVLRRVSVNVLALDIPDAPPVTGGAVTYRCCRRSFCSGMTASVFCASMSSCQGRTSWCPRR